MPEMKCVTRHTEKLHIVDICIAVGLNHHNRIAVSTTFGQNNYSNVYIIQSNDAQSSGRTEN